MQQWSIRQCALRLSLYTLLAGMVMWGLHVPSAHASLSVSPPRTVFRAPAGSKLVGSYTVKNNADQPVQVTIEPEVWGTPAGQQGKQPADWVVFESREHTLEAGQSLQIPYEITMPEQPDRAELMAQVFFTTTSGGGAGVLRTRLGTIIYIAVEGLEVVNVEFLGARMGLHPSTEGATPPDRVVLELLLINRGNVHAVPEGQVSLFDAQGQRVAQIPIRGGWAMLSGQQETYRAIGEGVILQPGNYTARVALTYGKDLNKETPLTADLKIKVGDDYQVEVAKP
jgi:hypothetical protein